MNTRTFFCSSFNKYIWKVNIDPILFFRIDGDLIVPCKIVIGGFYGDEGKGKLISYLALKDKPSILVRAGVGPNAGHTVEFQGRIYKLRQLPCGFVSPKTRLLVGSGVLVNPDILLKEIEETQTQDRIGLDARCGIIESTHLIVINNLGT